MYSNTTLASGASTGALAFTGSNSLWTAVAGMAVLVTGLTLLRLGRSMRQVAQQD